MGLPKGTNNGNHGKKGRSGRKSAYKERVDADRLWEMWFTKRKKNELHKSIVEEGLSMEDAFLINSLNLKERTLIAVFNKLYPQLKHDLQDNVTVKDS